MPPQVSGLWLVLVVGTGVAVALALANRLAMRGAKKLARTERFKGVASRVSSTVRSVSSVPQRLGRKSAHAGRQGADAGAGARPGTLEAGASGGGMLETVASGSFEDPLQKLDSGGSQTLPLGYPPPLGAHDPGAPPGYVPPLQPAPSSLGREGQQQGLHFRGSRYPPPDPSSPATVADMVEVLSMLETYTRHIEQLVLSRPGQGQQAYPPIAGARSRSQAYPEREQMV
jgi:hypothetical protein